MKAGVLRQHMLEEERLRPNLRLMLGNLTSIEVQVLLGMTQIGGIKNPFTNHLIYGDAKTRRLRDCES